MGIGSSRDRYMDAIDPERGIISDKSRKLVEAWDKPDPKHGHD